MKVIYQNARIYYDIEFSIISKNIIQLIGIIPLNTSGFKIYRDDCLMLGNYSDYKKIYKTVNGGYQYSNDGSVYTVPAVGDPLEPEEPPVVIDPEPTVLERLLIAEEEISATSDALEELIYIVLEG